MATRKNKEKNKENTKNKTNNKEQKNKTNKKKYHFQKTKLYKLYLTELEKLKGGGLEEVEKFMGGDWLDNLGIRKLGSLISETIEVPYMLFGASGMFLKQTVEAVWISKIYYWVKENIWENSFIRGFFDIFMKVGGKIGEAIYFIYILLTKIVFDIMEKKLRSVWLWVLTLITTLGVFDWAGSSGMLGSTIGSFLTSSVNGPIINFFNTFNFWNFLGTIITGIFSILGNVWGGVTTFISSYLFFSSFFQVVLVIAILWGLNTLRLDYNKSNPELAELNKHKKLRNTMKNQKESKILSEKENENENENEKKKENENENENENASQRSSVSVSESSTKPKRIIKKRPSKKVLESIPENTTEENEKEAISVKSFNIPYKEALTDKNMSSFQKLRANFMKNGKVPMPANENGLRGGGGDNGFQNLSTKKLLEKLNKISKSTMDVSKESNSMGFQLALFCGFIKETKDGYVFTPHAAKTIKSFIISSHTSIHKNCKGDCKMEEMKEMGEMEEMGEMKEMKEMGGNTKKRTTRKNNEELRTIDLDSVIDTLKAFEFVQTAVVHALVRKSNETTKDERKDENVLQYLKKEDIEWLKERDPEQIKIAIKVGILTSDLELTHISTGIAKDGDIINGISIKEQFEKYYSSVPQ